MAGVYIPGQPNLTRIAINNSRYVALIGAMTLSREYDRILQLLSDFCNFIETTINSIHLIFFRFSPDY